MENKERLKLIQERLRLKRLGQPTNKEDMEAFIKRNAPILKKRALKLHKRIEKSPTTKKIVEKGVKAVVQNLAKQDGKEIEKKDIKINEKDYKKAEEFY